MATELIAQKINARVEATKHVGEDNIGLAIGNCVEGYSATENLELGITDDSFTFARHVWSY